MEISIYSDASFLAHGWASGGDAEMQPVYLTTGLENPNGALLRIFVGGAEMGSALADAAYARAISIFDGTNEEDFVLARAQWKELKERGFLATYRQQGENGRWEKKA
ncbi:MAG TPA: DNA polymerase III subunit chi [Methylocella sp.]